MKIHHEGYVTIVLVLLFSVLAVWAVLHFTKMFYPTFSVALLLFIVWWVVLYFFRVPCRQMTTLSEQTVISPANGKVVEIKKTIEREFLQKEMIQVSIFMSPLNVHLNKYPLGGKIVYSAYYPGKYLVAWAPKSSDINERHSVVIEDAKGRQILVKQIAGFLARRIVNYAKVGEMVRQNDELGFIKFGSRVDIFLPVESDIMVSIGQKTVEGVTQIAQFK